MVLRKIHSVHIMSHVCGRRMDCSIQQRLHPLSLDPEMLSGSGAGWRAHRPWSGSFSTRSPAPPFTLCFLSALGWAVTHSPAFHQAVSAFESPNLGLSHDLCSSLLCGPGMAPTGKGVICPAASDTQFLLLGFLFVCSNTDYF